MLNYLLLIAGFAALIKGADLLVSGAAAIARRLRVSNLVIGLTVVAFGTSAPELFINVFASAQGNSGIAVGNILGSNIANILLILGVSAVIFPLAVQSTTVWKEIPFSLLAALVLGILANDALLDGLDRSALTCSDGLVLIAFFAIFMYYIVTIARKTGIPEPGEGRTMSVGKAAVFVLLGLAGLVFGGRWIIDGAVEIATGMGVSEYLMGLTVVAIGTSLPELATSAVAAWKKNADISIGNVVGSNIFNIFWVLGISAIIRPLPFQPSGNVDVAVTIVTSLLLFAFLFIGKRHILERSQGILFLAAYAGYMAFLVIRG